MSSAVVYVCLSINIRQEEEKREIKNPHREKQRQRHKEGSIERDKEKDSTVIR